MTTARSPASGDFLNGLSALPLAALLGCAAAPAPPVAPGSPASDTPACRPATVPTSRFAVTVLGSGGPVAVGRAASSYLVSLDGAPRILIDVGPGAFARLGEMRVEVGTVDTILLTHLHVDHAGDLPGFVKSRDLSTDGMLTFRVSGPLGAGPYPSTTAFVNRLFGREGAFAYLAGFRNELRFAVTDLPIAPADPPHEVLHEDDLRVASIAVDHGDAPAVAYRVEHAGRAAVFSGDLASKNDNLARLAANADLLVYDTSVLDPPGSEKPALRSAHAAAAHRRGRRRRPG